MPENSRYGLKQSKLGELKLADQLIRKEVLFRIITPLISIVVLLALLEFSARLYLTEFSPPRNHYEFRKTCPAPYKNASYFSEKFISESFHQPSHWIYPKGTRLIIPGDYQGTYFNVKNGLRVTTSQPRNFKHTVYLFGGSTVYDSEVPDDLTIASQLQSLFNSRYGDEFIVQNYGTTTVTIAQELERLKTIQPKPNDIVIFYDGVNDIYQGLFYANPQETMIERNRRAVKEVNLFRRIQLNVYQRWYEQSSLVQIFFDPINRSFPAHLNDPGL
ncbi:MAG TPA: SGNH/GDSL hydrolase family protein, partial [Acidobacteriota bacterium]